MTGDSNSQMGTEDKRQYLGFIQNVIDRLANNSASLKQWLAAIIALLLTWAVKESDECILIVGILVSIAFWIMDAQYLRIERAYRVLYRQAVSGKTSLYDLNWQRYGKGARAYLCAFFSWSTCYYIVIIMAIVITYMLTR
ncbi:hypothetical protein PG2000B_1105 [Bifidobacterium pseudolongum subsp. globosum]|uniref:hypothetical protein n=1 Tax=Bifidobacterium pseudolongum TaxID=1694 RepID=UPI00102050CB|nr:hypothetical protein [Bifidobacterium pseudolongum]RYQ42412.1 hypothetical protein PG2000B_1105 [Bifidobacterium pseudolongum subsp. globosum]